MSRRRLPSVGLTGGGGGLRMPLVGGLGRLLAGMRGGSGWGGGGSSLAGGSGGLSDDNAGGDEDEAGAVLLVLPASCSSLPGVGVAVVGSGSEVEVDEGCWSTELVFVSFPPIVVELTDRQPAGSRCEGRRRGGGRVRVSEVIVVQPMDKRLARQGQCVPRAECAHRWWSVSPAAKPAARAPGCQVARQVAS